VIIWPAALFLSFASEGTRWRNGLSKESPLIQACAGNRGLNNTLFSSRSYFARLDSVNAPFVPLA
jgi:hypothetical protein